MEISSYVLKISKINVRKKLSQLPSEIEEEWASNVGDICKYMRYQNIDRDFMSKNYKF